MREFFTANRFKYNTWQRRICILSVQLYSYVTSVNSVFVFDNIINNSGNFRIKHAYLTVKKCNFM